MRSAGARALARVCAALSHVEIAVEIDVSRAHVTHLANGTREPSLRTAIRIERAYGIPASSWIECVSETLAPDVDAAEPTSMARPRIEEREMSPENVARASRTLAGALLPGEVAMSVDQAAAVLAAAGFRPTQAEVMRAKARATR